MHRELYLEIFVILLNLIMLQLVLKHIVTKFHNHPLSRFFGYCCHIPKLNFTYLYCQLMLTDAN